MNGWMDGFGMEWNGIGELGMDGMEWSGMEWNGMEWNGMEWNGMENGIGWWNRMEMEWN